MHTSPIPHGRALLIGLLAAATAAVGAPSADAASSLLWTDTTDDTIGRAGLDGAGAVPSFIGGGSSPNAVVVRGRYVYWTNGTGGGTIGRANLDGTGANQAFITGLGGSPFGLAVDEAHVYWTLPLTNRIGRANLDGSDVTQTFLGAGSGVSFPGAIALTGTRVYWTNVTAETIGRANLDGSGASGSFLSAGAAGSSPFGLAVDDTHLYWTNEATDAVSRANLDGSGVNLSFVPAAPTMRGLAVGGGGIFWGDTAAGAIGRADIDGGGVVPGLVTGLTDAGGVGLALSGAAFDSPGADFGDRVTGTGASSAVGVTLRNTGNTTLDLDGATLSGASAGAFVLVNDGCGGRALPVAGSCTVQVAFDPSADGAASATLGVGGAGLDAAATAALTGSGVSGATPAPAPPPAPGADPSSPPGSGPGADARLVLGASAPQRRGALGRAVATVRVPGPGRVTGTGTVRIGRTSRTIGVVPATARRAGTVRLTLTLPAAVRREIARTGHVTSRVSLRLAGVAASGGARSVRIAAPASRRMARQWIGRRLGPWRVAPRLSARERSGLRISDRRLAWSAVVVR